MADCRVRRRKQMCYRILLCAVFGSVVCQAEPYWIRYDAASGLYPEQEGWTRGVSDPAPERWLEDGKLFIDSRADWFLTDGYAAPLLPGMLTLSPGETFVMRWRVKIDEMIGYSAPGVLVLSDDHELMSLQMGLDFIELAYGETRAQFSPYEWHEFTLQSSDMSTYSLEIDGVFGFSATALDESPFAPDAGWGDLSSHRALSEWEYVELGVVPEPTTAGSLIAGTVAVWSLKRSGLRRGRVLV
jgi:hypothetical protein